MSQLGALVTTDPARSASPGASHQEDGPASACKPTLTPHWALLKSLAQQNWSENEADRVCISTGINHTVALAGCAEPNDCDESRARLLLEAPLRYLNGAIGTLGGGQARLGEGSVCPRPGRHPKAED